MTPTSIAIVTSSGRKPFLSSCRMASVITPVAVSPHNSETCNSSEIPSAPPRNSATSVAIAAISEAIHMPRKLVAAKLRKATPGDDPELRRHPLKQHRDQVRRQHHPQKLVAVSRTRLDVRSKVARVHVADRGHDGGTCKPQQ